LSSRSLADTPWRPGSRVARLKASHSYGFVLILIAIVFVFTAVASDGNWADSTLLVLQAVTLAAALYTAGFARADSVVSVALVALAGICAVALVLFGGTVLEALVGILSGLITLATIVIVGIGIVDQGEPNIQSVTGAVCVYILFGLTFLFLYSVIAALGSGDFFAQGTDGTRSLRFYFSYITLATVGYGDYTAASDLGRTLAVVEALLGQLYLVTVLAAFVARARPRTPSS